MIELTPADISSAVLSVASGIVLLANAGEKIVRAWKAAKAPNERQNSLQNDRLNALEEWKREQEEWKKGVDRKLDNDKLELSAIHDGLRASYQAQLALLDHGIDGNNIEQMQQAKVVLQQHLISNT